VSEFTHYRFFKTTLGVCLAWVEVDPETGTTTIRWVPGESYVNDPREIVDAVAKALERPVVAWDGEGKK
jgi:hypothetical protein